MKELLKIFVGVILALFIIEGCAENKTPKVDKVQNQIEFWKQTIAIKDNKPKVYYHLYSGERYENEKWVTEKPAENEDYFVGEVVSFWSDNKIGSYFEMESSSPSGDWVIISKNYYGTNNNLSYLYWAMNTTQTQQGGLTIEKKYSFNKSGILIRKCESVFNTASKKPIENPNYMNHEVKYWKTIKDLPFVSLLKLEK